MRPAKFTVFTIGITFITLSLYPLTILTAQTANDNVRPYKGVFRAGVNFDIFRGFTDEDLGLLAAGDPTRGVQGAGIKAVRPGFFEDFAEIYGYESRVNTFKYYESLGLKDNTMIVGFPSDAHRDDKFYCPGVRSTVFKNMDTPIWDNGENGTPVNDTNYYALYIWKTVKTYKNHIKFWEVWNEPGYDYTGGKGWLPKGAPGSWWDNNPQPCEYKLRAPIFTYVRLLRITYEVVKSIDPDAYVVTSGLGFPSFLDAILRNTDNPDGGKVTPQYPHKGGAWFDGIGYHAYPHFDDALRAYNDQRNDWDYFRHSDAAAADPKRTKDFFQDVLNTYGYNGSKYPNKIWLITECNVPRKEFGDFAGSSDMQKNFMPKAYVNCMKNDIWQFHVFKIAEETDFDKATYEFDVMGLYKTLHYSNKTQPEMTDAGISYKTTSQILFGLKYDSLKTKAMQLPAGTEGGAFKDENGIFTYVVWAKTTKDKSEIASAIYTFPQNFNLKNSVKRMWDFSKTKTQTPQSAYTFNLTATPIFITETLLGAVDMESCSNTVILEDLTTSATRTWTIQTGTNTFITKTEKKVIIAFAGQGEYAVVLTAKDANNTEIGKQSIKVKINELPIANFTYELQNPFVKLKNRASTNSTDLKWTFSDNTTSLLPDLTKTFYQSGNFNMTLTAKNACGEHSKTVALNIKAPTAPKGKTANEQATSYNNPFRAGVNMRFTQGWTDEQVADIAAGNIMQNTEGVGAKNLRTSLPEYFTKYWGADVRTKTFQHFGNLDLKDIILTIGNPDSTHRDPNFYCYNQQTSLFNNMYLDIWDNGEGETPVNDSNYFARYVYDLVKLYKNEVKFWEVWDTPGWDIEAKNGWKPRNMQHNWWQNNPDPCELGIHAPVQSLVRMMRIAYEVIKKEDPTAFVVFSGAGFPSLLDAVVRNTDNPSDGVATPSYPNGGGAYFDAVLYNVFPHVDGSLAAFDQTLQKLVYKRHSDAAVKSIVAHKTELDSVLHVYGYDGQRFPPKNFIIGEINVPRKPLGSMGFGNDEVQKNFILKSYITAAANGILTMSVKSVSEEVEFGQATEGGQIMGLYQKLPPTPYMTSKNVQGIAFKSISDILFGAQYDSARTKALTLPTPLHGAAFKNGLGKYTYALWAETKTDLLEFVKDSFSFPTALNTPNLYKREWSFSADQNVSLVSTKNIPLSGTPIFLSEEVVLTAPPVAAFTSDYKKACPPLTVKFQDKSSDAVSYLWRFTGATPATSTERNPIVIFNKNGSFDVSLEVKNANGTHTNLKTQYVITDEKPKADFTFTVDKDGVVAFQTRATRSFSMIWDFGDGAADFSLNPIHRYREKKTYLVKMIAVNYCGRDTIEKRVNLLTATPEPSFVEALNFRTFPNPFDRDLTVTFQLAETQYISLTLFDISGKKVAQLVDNQRFTEGGHSLVLKPQLTTNGLYFLQLQTEKGTVYRKVVRF